MPMQVESFAYELETKMWSSPMFPALDSPRTLVLVFGAPEVINAPECMAQLSKAYPTSVVVGCSSAGEIHGTTVRDKTLSVTVSKFEKTDLVLSFLDVSGPNDSFATGQSLAKKLAAKPGLRGVMILSEGLNVNGSELVRGINDVLDESIVVSGGLSGDGSRFKQTWVAVGSKVKSNMVAAVGFYGDFVQIGHGSKGGWDKFGVERVVTKSEGNVLYELDGKPALALYKEYLGDKAAELPASGLLFPLSLRATNKDDKALVRTLLAVDHEKNSLTFAGDIPRGYLAQLMKADFERLIGGASLAAAMAKDTGTPVGKDSLVVAISCVGRRLVLGDRTEEEVEAVLTALPKEKAQNAHITGFYSYGEISPYASGHCDLHNQTMTLTVFSESPIALPKKAPAAVTTAAKTTNGGSGPISKVPPPTPSRPLPPPPPRAARSPIATGPFDDSDLDIQTANTDTRELPSLPDAGGLSVASLSYDLNTRRWNPGTFPKLDSPRTLVLVFGAPETIGDTECIAQLVRAYPKSIVVGCSSAGEIHGTSVKDKSLSVTVTKFEKTDLVLSSFDVAGPGDSFTTGQTLAKKLAAKPGLRGVMILSEGLNVNGSELVRGVNDVLDDSVVVTGGLSGDGSRFKQTWVAVGSKVKSNMVAAVGFYGDYVQIGHGSKGGWDKFGVERVVTKSEGNVLYELDGKPALALYKEYLGDKAAELPASGLLFPLSLRASTKDDKSLVRTLLAVDHQKLSLTFAGDIPKGYLAQLMKADFERLIGGASLAAAMAKDNGTPIGRDSLVVAISCVGRRLVLGDRTEEEVEAVLGALPKEKVQHAHITGFYSYGEISPYASGHCDLHNQTMTLTVFSESPMPLPKRVATNPAKHVVTTQTMKSQASLLPDQTAAMPKAPAPPPPVPVAQQAAPPPPAPVSSGTSLSGAHRPPPGTPFVRLPLQGTGAGANVQRAKRDGDITLVTISGRLTESFKGEALGRELRGTVVIDLANVDRVTSFGVREWLSMLSAMTDVRRVFLVRCSESIVNQLGMIRKFSGNGQVVSFFAPYLCGSCSEQFERSFDCERDAEMIRAGRPTPTACPQCGGEGTFDDDARSYFAFATPHLSTAVPSEVRAIVDELEANALAAPREAVDKIVEGNVTRVRLHGNLGANVRWKRVLDGIEGALVMDLGGVTGVEANGIASLDQSLRGIGSDVSSILLERCPAMLLERFMHNGLPRRVKIASAMLDAYCASCAVHRPALVHLEEHGEALDAGQAPHVDCKRCNGELELRNNSPAALQFLRTLRPAAAAAPPISAQPPQRISDPIVPSLGGMALGGPPSGQVAAAAPTLRPTDDVAGPAAASVATPNKRAPSSPVVAFALGALTLAVIGLFALQVVRGNNSNSNNNNSNSANAGKPAAETTPTPATSSSQAPHSTTNWSESVELPPAWVERPVVFEGNDVYVVGKGELAASAEIAISNARTDAVVRLVKQLHQDLAGSPMHEFLQARVKENDKSAAEAIATRYTKQFGTTSAPERVESAVRKRDAGFDGYARYKLSKAKYQEVLAAYKETATTQGMVVGRFFPLLETTMHSDGDLVILSTQRGRPAAEQGVRPGDVVLSIGARPVTTVDSLSRLATEEWNNTAPRQSMTMDIESAGAKRTLRFFKPATP